MRWLDGVSTIPGTGRPACPNIKRRTIWEVQLCARYQYQQIMLFDLVNSVLPWSLEAIIQPILPLAGWDKASKSTSRDSKVYATTVMSCLVPRSSKHQLLSINSQDALDRSTWRTGISQEEAKWTEHICSECILLPSSSGLESISLAKERRLYVTSGHDRIKTPVTATPTTINRPSTDSQRRSLLSHHRSNIIIRDSFSCTIPVFLAFLDTDVQLSDHGRNAHGVFSGQSLESQMHKKTKKLWCSRRGEVNRL